MPLTTGTATYSLGEIMAVVSPVVVALALMAWFFVNKWLETYQKNLDKKVDKFDADIVGLTKKVDSWEEKARDNERAFLIDCNHKHESVIRRDEYERDRTTLYEQGKTITGKVEQILEALESDE